MFIPVCTMHVQDQITDLKHFSKQNPVLNLNTHLVHTGMNMVYNGCSSTTCTMYIPVCTMHVQDQITDLKHFSKQNPVLNLNTHLDVHGTYWYEHGTKEHKKK